MNWEYFTRDELACQGTGECDMNEDCMYKLMTIREELDRPMILSSAYRHPAHNSAIGGVKDSPHIFGRAVDIAPYPIDWDARDDFHYLGGFVLGIAAKMGVDIRWGGDWNASSKFQGKRTTKDNSFDDLVHFELKG